MKKVGVIGAGNRMRNLVRLFVNESPNITITGVYDPNPESIEKFKETFSTEVYKSYKKLIQDVDWVFIGSINSAHKKQIMSAMKKGKNIFSEKPVAISFEQCKRIKKEYDKRNIRFLISYPLRYSPVYKKLKKIIESKEIGDITSLEFNETLSFSHGAFIMGDWRRLERYSGGHLLEKCCHDFDLVNWIVDDMPRKVSSFGGLNFFLPKNSGMLENLRISKDHWERKKFKNPFTSKKDIVDNQVVIMEYMNGVRASFHTNCSSSLPERRMYICGTKGTIYVNILAGLIQVKTIDSPQKVTSIDEENKGGHGGGDPLLIRDIIDVINGGESSIEKPLDKSIISAVTTIFSDESRKKEKVVDLLPYWEELGYKIE